MFAHWPPASPHDPVAFSRAPLDTVSVRLFLLTRCDFFPAARGGRLKSAFGKVQHLPPSHHDGWNVSRVERRSFRGERSGTSLPGGPVR